LKAKKEAPLFFSMTYEFLEVYLPRQTGHSLCTVKSYRDALTLFRRYLLNVRGMSISKFTFGQCGRDFVLGFMEYLKTEGCAPATRNHRLAALKSYIWFASDKDVSIQSIALEISKIPRCKEHEPERDVLPEPAISAILSQPADTRMGLRDRTLLVLMYDSACRLDEILSLIIDNVNIDRNNTYIRVVGKGDKERVVSVSEAAAAHLRLYINNFRKRDNPDTDLLFYTIIKGKAGKMSEGNVERFLKQYADKARKNCPEMPNTVYPHMFRRTRATHMYQDGVALPLISRILGHVNLDTTTIYAKPSLGMMRDAMESASPSQVKDEQPLWVGSEEEMARKSGLR